MEEDEVWVERARGDAEAFAELVRRYQDRLYRLAMRMTGDAAAAEDLTQEAFLRAYRALPRFREGAAFAPWLYRIATNLCLNHRQRRRPLPNAEEGWSASTEEVVERREIQAAVQRALLRLPRHYRVVVVLRHLHDLSYQEIATALELPLGTIKTHLFRARSWLQRELQKEGLVHELPPSSKPAPSLPGRATAPETALGS